MHPNWWGGTGRMILSTPHTRAHPPCSPHLHELLWCPGCRSHLCPSPISPTVEWDSPTCCFSQPSASLTQSSTNQRVPQPSLSTLPCPVLPKIAWRGQREDPAKLWVMPGWYQEQTNHLPGKQSPAPLTWPVTVAQAGKNKYFVHQIAVWHPQGQQCKCSLPRPWMHQRLTAVH